MKKISVSFYLISFVYLNFQFWTNPRNGLSIILSCLSTNWTNNHLSVYLSKTRSGNFLVAVIVKSWVNLLIWLLIGCSFLCSQSGASLLVDTTLDNDYNS